MAVAAEPQETVGEVVVEESKDGEQGGFRPLEAQIGPFKSRSLQDTPYSISVITQEMIENRQITNLSEALKYLTSTQMEARGGLDVGRAQSRGMEAGVVDTNHLDGMNVVGTTALPMEMFDRVEVINSLTGAYYGPASPGGNFNYVLKRPTATPLYSFSTGYGSNGGWMGHADLGGYVDSGHQVGYRLNAVKEEGAGYVTDSDLDRRLISAAVDLRPREDTVLELNGSYYAFDKFGYPGGFAYGSTIALPAAPDPTTVGYGQGYAGMKLETTTLSVTLKHELNQDWSLTGGMLHQIVDRQLLTVTNTLTNSNGTYTSRLGSSAAGRFIVTSNSANLNGRFKTGPVGHELALGVTGYVWDIEVARSSLTSTLGTASIYSPRFFGAPTMITVGPRYHMSTNQQETVLLGDSITFDDHWSAMAVVSYSWINTIGFDRSGAKSGSYRDHGFSPTVAVTYKPVPPLSTYVAYADTLEIGDTAPSGTANEGQTLAPLRSQQYEVGVKANLGRFDANLALFRIERPFAYAGDDNVYKAQGQQVNNGVEVGVTGEVLPNTKVFGGVTYLDPKLTETSSAATSGKQVVGVPDYQANLLIEYAMPWVPGLFVNANIHYTGERAANNTNTSWADGYTTLDLGARFESENLYGKKTTIRLAVNNVFDETYWASIFPGSINGVVGSNTAFLGTPLEARLSATVAF